ncbi:MAG: hypothetical protein RLZZ546_1961 [Bacteroidota bacterium]|jgi:thiol-disulfide isomerase/thioredoxin
MKAIFYILILFSLGCVSPNQTFTKIAPGIWRGVLFLDNEAPLVSSKKDVIVGVDNNGELPFTFEVIYDNENDFHLEIHNADERIRVDNIQFGRDRATAKDTLYFNFEEYGTHIKAICEERIMEGYWYVPYRNNYKIKFKAYQGDAKRFKNDHIPLTVSFNGRHALTFSKGSIDEYPAIGDFTQKDNKITGTILTETGDYRYMEGLVKKDKALLSCFDGSHAFLIEMKKLANDSIIGEFRSGIHHREPFDGIQSNSAVLKDGFDLVSKKSNSPFHIKLLNHENKIIDTKTHPEYIGKLKIYEIMGTWCPNCKDATEFLIDFGSENPDVKITALAFERYRDTLKSHEIIRTYKVKMKLPYEILLAGYFDKKEASASLPQIEKIMAYPTLIITDEKDVIQKVYTGFYGPATKEYEAFKKEFTSVINAIRKK